MLKRKIETKIDKWIKNGKNALLVSGARQVGKTYSIRECLKNNNCDYLEINLIDNPEFVEVLDSSSSVEDIVINLSIAKNYSFKKGQTILFIDEVQECKDVVTKIKFWVDEGSYRFILSGSLLGIELEGLRSAPVGYLGEIKMFPLDFEEFIVASGVKEESISYLKKCFEEVEPVTDVVHETMMKHFKRYLVVGGMPAAVSEYVESGDMNAVSDIQESIIKLYKRDFSKYEAKDKKLMLQQVYDLIPSELLKQNRRFNYSDIKKGLRFERTESSFVWLTSAGVSISVFNATEPRVALNQNKKSSLVKLYLSDVGLLTSMYGSSMKMSILMDKSGSNMGGIYENVVVQELYAHGFEPYYYNSHKQGELDVVVEYEGSVLPIEVKSGKDYTVHSAINNVLKNQEYQIPKAIVFSNYNLSKDDRTIYYPVYMSGFFTNKVELPVLDKIESL